MNNECELTFVAIAIKDNVGYASDYDKNGLFEVDMKTGKCEFLDIFEEQPIQKKRLHSCAKWIEDKIYFIPDSANKIAVYNLNNRKLESISIPKPNENLYTFYKKNYNFIDALEYKGYLWLLPCTYPGVLKLDIQTNEIEIINGWINDIEYYFRAKICLQNNKIIIPNGIGNEVFIFDLETEKGKIINIGSQNNGNMCVRKIRDKYWFAPRSPGAIISWNIVTNEIKEYENYPEDFEMGKITFSNIYSYREDIVFSPANANKGLVFSKEKLKVEKNIQWKSSDSSMVQHLFETETHYYYRELLAKNINRYFKINKIDNSLSDFRFYYMDTNEKKEIIIEKLLSKKKILKENVVIDLQDFINKITSTN